MNLAIDIGNTLTKLTLMEQGHVLDSSRKEGEPMPWIAQTLATHPQIEAVVLVSSCGDKAELERELRRRVKRFLRFDATTPVPLKNGYETPATLGPDRMAAAVGASVIYPRQNVLVVDFGTAITFDVVSAAGVFVGGNIAPGAECRFKALHHFTRTLPLCELPESLPQQRMGTDTLTAIQNGVVQGIIYEIEGYRRDVESRYPDLQVIFTGGDSYFFAKQLKNTIFATYDLVALGLNRILEYNAE
ncbi:MAG: type III pantothenate kinase [Alistipes sp.]|nr:type III pantothenate kinase [Alistipes sp.]